jgi:hypothetical protein
MSHLLTVVSPTTTTRAQLKQEQADDQNQNATLHNDLHFVRKRTSNSLRMCEFERAEKFTPVKWCKIVEVEIPVPPKDRESGNSFTAKIGY